MKKLTLLFLCCAALTAAAQAAAIPEAAKIDAILAKAWQKQNLTPNAPATDEVFLRRVYLDVIGRIPTLEEARSFLASNDADKRGKLIDALLASDGYVSNFFNYYADILRLQTDTKGRLTGEAYANWLKNALKKNQSYDSMVRELLTTDGNAWDTGAIGFYMRDQGMPLDHLAATVQIFLGTRIECAQCHNHPFDKWTQKDYYQMAAFTYGMDTRKGYGLDLKNSGLDRKAMRGPEGQQLRRDFKEVQESIKEVTKSLRYTQIKETDKLPKLPPEYKYPDAKPGETMQPKTLFGHDAIPAAGETRLDAFAKWMTSPQNPRFTTVIANRLWKKAMGAGLIEPVDEITDSTVPSNPELMSYLEEVMAQKGYNLKEYLRVVLNSQVYQRMPSTKDVLLGEVYAFTGPLMRRMSAEQIWDSIATLMHGDIDKQAASPNEGAIQRLAALGKLYDALTSRTPMELVKQIREAGGAGNAEKEAKIKELTEQMNAARQDGKKEEAAKLARQVASLRREDRQQAFTAVLGEEGAREFAMDMRAEGGKAKKGKANGPVNVINREEIRKMLASGADRKTIREKMEQLRAAGKNANAIASATRASELPSPAPRGHMLRIFGQSDREIIENASREAAVPQALNMLNGPVADALSSPVSYFAQQISLTENVDEKMEAVYLGLLCRRPTEGERKILSEVVAERGDTATADVIHALMNTGEFLFVK